jgi:hypothetical protein
MTPITSYDPVAKRRKGGLRRAVQIIDRNGKSRDPDAYQHLICDPSIPLEIRFNLQEKSFVVFMPDKDGNLGITTVGLDAKQDVRHNAIAIDKSQGAIHRIVSSSSGELLYVATTGGQPFRPLDAREYLKELKSSSYKPATKPAVVTCYSISQGGRQLFSHEMPRYIPIEPMGYMKKPYVAHPTTLSSMRLTKYESALVGNLVGVGVGARNHRKKFFVTIDPKRGYRMFDFDQQSSSSVRFEKSGPVVLVTHTLR